MPSRILPDTLVSKALGIPARRPFSGQSTGIGQVRRDRGYYGKSNRDEDDDTKREAENLNEKDMVRMDEASGRNVVTEFTRRVEDAFGRMAFYLTSANRRLRKNFFATTDEDWHYYLKPAGYRILVSR